MKADREPARAVVLCDRCGVRVSAPGLRVHQRSYACLAAAPLRATAFQRAAFGALLALYEARGYHRSSHYASASAVATHGLAGYGPTKPQPVGRALAALELPCGENRGGPVVTLWQQPGDGLYAMWLGYAPRSLDMLAKGAAAWVEAEGFGDALRRMEGA